MRTEANGRVTFAFDLGAMEGFEPREPNLPPDVARFPEIDSPPGHRGRRWPRNTARSWTPKPNPAAVQPHCGQADRRQTEVAEKEAAILDYLDREVRYTGIEFGEAAIVPQDPAETLSHKYGDCKDKATLLVAMLRAAGIPAYVALLNAGSRMDVPADMPGMGLFDHAIVYVPGHSLRAVDRRHRPLCAPGTVADRRSGPAGTDCAPGDDWPGKDARVHFEG